MRIRDWDALKKKKIDPLIVKMPCFWVFKEWFSDGITGKQPPCLTLSRGTEMLLFSEGSFLISAYILCACFVFWPQPFSYRCIVKKKNQHRYESMKAMITNVYGHTCGCVGSPPDNDTVKFLLKPSSLDKRSIFQKGIQSMPTRLS